MWLCTKLGFYSIVQKDAGEFHVRARTRTDLENLIAAAKTPDLEIHRSPSADYRFRAIVRRQDLKKILQALLISIDYGNFKAEIGRRPDQREKLDAYHDLWGSLFQIQQLNE